MVLYAIKGCEAMTTEKEKELFKVLYRLRFEIKHYLLTEKGKPFLDMAIKKAENVLFSEEYIKEILKKID